MSVSLLRFCIGIRDTRERHPRQLAGNKLPVPTSKPVKEKNNSRRLSTMLGIKKVCPANVELYLKNVPIDEGGMDAIPMITSVTFYCEPGTCFVHKEDTSHSDVHNLYYPPFTLKRLVLEPCEFNIKIKLRDQSVHFMKQTFDLTNYSESFHECNLNVDKIPKVIDPSPLPSLKFYIEFDLLVPYPYSLTESSSPHHIADFIKKVSLRPCKYVGYYLDEPLDGLSVNEKLLYELSWKLALVSIPLTADRVALPSVMKLKSPAVKGASGLAGVASVLSAIESAFDELKVLRRPGLRIGIDACHYDIDQRKKITLQYFKFYDVIEDIVAEHEAVEFQFPSTENPKEKVHLNKNDILVQKIEKSHQFSMVGNHMGDRHDITSLINKASCLEELIEFTCPVATRSYRYDLRPILSKGHLEFRFEMPEIDFEPMSCVIAMLLRFVSRAAILPSPKKFSKKKNKGQGKTLAMRKEKCFKWLIQDRYLEDYFRAVKSSSDDAQHQQPALEGDNSDVDYLQPNNQNSMSTIMEDISPTNSLASLVRSVASIHTCGSSQSNNSFIPLQSMTNAMSSSSLLDPLLSSMQDKLNDSVVSCPPPPPHRKPSNRSMRTSKISLVEGEDVVTA